ncbi:MAG: UDP-N-acetylmuramoyl-L-alanine--D-glutamate ligase [Clostridia bacterium]|nr:UDP-N-acetylmuramoyl-L-alanine--D-glutamate ligase [Clostridia bacterium]
MYPKQQIFFVLGLSRSGRASAEFLLSQGAKTYIYDDVSSERVETTMQELEEKGAKRVSKELLMKTAEVCDVLVLSPGIPIDHPLAVAFKRNGKAVVGETELAARYMRCQMVAITGTNGKTTTVSLLTEILRSGGWNAQACGNVGTPMLDFRELDEKSVAVAEISSFQLETLNSLCPHVAIVLNVTEDHLNRHYNMENYIFLKAKLLKNMSEAEYAVLNYDDRIVRGFAEKTKAKIVWFSVRERVNGAYYENGELYYNGEKICPASELFIHGLHNIQNALSAVAAAKILGLKTSDIARALSSFKGVKHRIERVGEVNGVVYIDDSKGTNVDATVKAVRCMKTETVLLLGGKNKGYDYSALFAELSASNVVHAVLYGENRHELYKCARAQSFEKITLCDRFEFAVRVAAMIATSGQTVLLSPASASFDEFASYEERGDTFVRIVQALGEAQNSQKKQSKEQSVATDGDESNDDIDGQDVVEPVGGEEEEIE